MADQTVSIALDLSQFQKSLRDMQRALSTFEKNLTAMAASFNQVEQASNKARKTVVDNFELESRAARVNQEAAVQNALKTIKERDKKFRDEIAKEKSAAEVVAKAEEAKRKARSISLAEALKEDDARIESLRRSSQLGLRALKFAEQRKREEITETQKRLAQAAAGRVQGGQARQQIGELINVDKLRGAPSAINQVQTSLLRLDQTVAKTGVSAARTVQIFNEMQRGIFSATTKAEAQVTNRLGAIQGSLERLKSANKGAVAQINIDWRTLARVGAFQIVHGLITRTTFLLREAISSARDFGRTIALIQTLTQNVSSDTSDWQRVLVDISNTFGTGLQDTATGIFEAVSNQIVNTTAEARQFGEEIAKLARVTNSSFDAAGTTVSSLINSYQLGIGNVNELNSKLFAAVDLGRFKLEDIAEQLGRAAPQANQLGISIDELLAGVATLTIEGRTTEASITLLRNVMLKFLKPTEELQELIESWGFSSGFAASQNLGLIGVVKKLNTEVSRSKLGVILQDMRAVEGITSLTANSFDNFASNFAKIGGEQALTRLRALGGEFETLANQLAETAQESDPDELFSGAVKIAFEETGAVAEREVNKIKNLFTVELGQSILETFVSINDSVGGFSDRLEQIGSSIANGPIIQTLQLALDAVENIVGVLGETKDTTAALTTVALSLGQAWITYRILSSAALTETIAKLAAVQIQISTADFKIKSLGGSLLNFGKSALTAFANPALLISSVVFLAGALQQQFQSLTQIQERFVESTRQAREQVQKQIQESGKAISDEYRKRLDEGTANIQGFFTQITKEARENQKNLENGANELTAFTKVQLDQRVKDFESFVKTVERLTADLSTEIAKRTENLAKLQLEADRQVFDFRLKQADITDQIIKKGIQQEAEFLSNLVKELDSAISESQKRVLGLQAQEQEAQFAFLQGIRNEQEQINALLGRAQQFAEKAFGFLRAGEPEEAAKAFAEASKNQVAAAASIKAQLEEARSNAQKAREESAKQNISAAKRAELLNQQNIEHNKALDLLKQLEKVERGRQDIVQNQINAERQLQAAREAEREAANRALAEVDAKAVEFERERERLLSQRVDSLGQIATQAFEQKDFDKALALIKEQDELLAQLQQIDLERVSGAREINNLELAQRALDQLKSTEEARNSIAKLRVAVEAERLQQAKDDLDVASEALVRQKQLLAEFKILADEGKKIRFLNPDGTKKDSEIVKAALESILVKMRELSNISVDAIAPLSGFESLLEAQREILEDFNRFGQEIDLSKAFREGINKLNAEAERFAGTAQIPASVKVDLNALSGELANTNMLIKDGLRVDPINVDLDTTNLERASEQVQQLLDATKKNISEVTNSLTQAITAREEIADAFVGQFKEARTLVKSIASSIEGIRIATPEFNTFSQDFTRGATPDEAFDLLRKQFETAKDTAVRFGQDSAQAQLAFSKATTTLLSINSEVKRLGSLGNGFLQVFGTDPSKIIESLIDLEKRSKEVIDNAVDVEQFTIAEAFLSSRLTLIDRLAASTQAEADKILERNKQAREENTILAKNIELRTTLRDLIESQRPDTFTPVEVPGLNAGASATGAIGPPVVQVNAPVTIEGNATDVEIQAIVEGVKRGVRLGLLDLSSLLR